MMKIIVTGGAGFLGSHLSHILIEQGHEIFCIDNLLTGNIENISDLLNNPLFHFDEFDVTKVLPKNYQVEQIYHLASPASPNIHSPKSYHALAFETMTVNTDGTKLMCELAINNGAKLLFASTSEIYGEPLEHPQRETYRGNVSTIGPRAVYDEAKRYGETIVSTYVRSKNLDGRIVRIFNTYGPNMAVDDGRVVTEFIKAALKNQALPIEGDGSASRSFCYVSDLIDGLILTMNKGDKGEVYNLGNTHEFTLLELAEKVRNLTNSNSKLSFNPYPKDSPTKRQPDISKARETFHWEPKISLDEGLPKVIDYIKQKIND